MSKRTKTNMKPGVCVEVRPKGQSRSRSATVIDVSPGRWYVNVRFGDGDTQIVDCRDCRKAS